MIGKNTLVVMGIFAAIFLGLGLMFLFILAESGLVRVPVFSSFYRPPEPTHVVTADPIDAAAFRALLANRISARAASGEKPPFSVTLTEKELTGVLHGVIRDALRDEAWTVERLQLALTAEMVELSGRLKRNSLTADLRVRFTPVVENGGLRLDPTDVRFGAIPIHPAMARQLAGVLFSRDFGTWVISFNDMRLNTVTTETGLIRLTISPR
jgi:hypothetical protein